MTHRTCPALAVVEAFALTLLATSALAQPSPLIIDSQRVDRAAPLPPSAPPKGLPRAGTVATPALNLPAGVVVRSVRVEGSTAPPLIVGAASRPFIGAPLDRPVLDKIAQAISNAYASTDIALYTVAIPQQDFSSGEVRVRVIEGYVEHVFLSGPASKGDQDLVKQYAARLTRERPLRRSTLERYLSLIRDIPGLKVDPQLVLEEARSGAVRLMLDLKRKPVEVGLSIDDRGVAYLGRTQMTLEADFNGMIRQGDQTKFIFATPTDFTQFHYYSITHSEPIRIERPDGAWPIRLSGPTKPTDSPIPRPGDHGLGPGQLSADPQLWPEPLRRRRVRRAEQRQWRVRGGDLQ